MNSFIQNNPFTHINLKYAYKIIINQNVFPKIVSYTQNFYLGHIASNIRHCNPYYTWYWLCYPRAPAFPDSCLHRIPHGSLSCWFLAISGEGTKATWPKAINVAYDSCIFQRVWGTCQQICTFPVLSETECWFVHVTMPGAMHLASRASDSAPAATLSCTWILHIRATVSTRLWLDGNQVCSNPVVRQS